MKKVSRDSTEIDEQSEDVESTNNFYFNIKFSLLKLLCTLKISFEETFLQPLIIKKNISQKWAQSDHYCRL